VQNVDAPEVPERSFGCCAHIIELGDVGGERERRAALTCDQVGGGACRRFVDVDAGDLGAGSSIGDRARLAVAPAFANGTRPKNQRHAVLQLAGHRTLPCS
jgi:hypothetical protein